MSAPEHSAPDVSEREALAAKLRKAWLSAAGHYPEDHDRLPASVEEWLAVAGAALAETAALRERLAQTERERDALVAVCDPSSAAACDLVTAAITRCDSLIPENAASAVLLAQWGAAYRSAATPAPGGSDAG